MVDSLHCAVGGFMHKINLWHVDQVESNACYDFLQSLSRFDWHDSISSRHDLPIGKGIDKQIQLHTRIPNHIEDGRWQWAKYNEWRVNNNQSLKQP